MKYKITAKKFEAIIEADNEMEAEQRFREYTQNKRKDDIMDIEQLPATHI